MENRRSTRKFSNKKISCEKLDRILRAGQLSPSGADKKPFVYVVVDDPLIRKKIKENCESIDKEFFNKSSDEFRKFMKDKKISLNKDFLIDAPILLVISGESGKPYWLESTWISITYVVLAVEYEGLSSLTYTPAKTDFLKDLLDLPKSLNPVCIMPIGYKKA